MLLAEHMMHILPIKIKDFLTRFYHAENLMEFIEEVSDFLSLTHRKYRLVEIMYTIQFMP